MPDAVNDGMSYESLHDLMAQRYLKAFEAFERGGMIRHRLACDGGRARSARLGLLERVGLGQLFLLNRQDYATLNSVCLVAISLPYVVTV